MRIEIREKRLTSKLDAVNFNLHKFILKVKKKIAKNINKIV